MRSFLAVTAREVPGAAPAQAWHERIVPLPVAIVLWALISPGCGQREAEHELVLDGGRATVPPQSRPIPSQPLPRQYTPSRPRPMQIDPNDRVNSQAPIPRPGEM